MSLDSPDQLRIVPERKSKQKEQVIYIVYPQFINKNYYFHCVN